MDVNKIKQSLSNLIIVHLMATLFFVFLLSHTVKAQEISPDSIRTDTTHVIVKDIEPLVTDTIIDQAPFDSISNTGGDTALLIPERKKIIPARATLYSAILPGLGQAYNGKYWKIPIIYTVFGTMYFLAANNHQKYSDFKVAYAKFGDDDRPVWSENFDEATLKDRMEFYKRNRDFNIIIGGLFYLLNILDANVDAHLMDFDVGDDLSLRIEPDINCFQASQKNSNVSGFGIKFVLSLNR